MTEFEQLLAEVIKNPLAVEILNDAFNDVEQGHDPLIALQDAINDWDK